MTRCSHPLLAGCIAGVLAGAAGLSAAAAAPAAAQIEPCVEHHPISPSEASGTPVAGNDPTSVSQVGIAVATALPPGTDLTGTLTGADRSLSLMGPVAADHTFFGRFGIDQYGDYTLAVSSGGASLATTVYTVGPQQHLCADALVTAQMLAAQLNSPGPVPTTTSKPAAIVPSTPTATGISVWLWLILLVAGVLLALLGAWLARPRTPATEERPVPGVPPTLTRPVCDWAVYFDRGGVLTCLRKAKGHECCRYIVSVESALLGNFLTKGRQGPDHAGDWSGAHGERFRIPDLGTRWDGLESWSWAGARSGPAGTLNWMQGYGTLPHGMAPPGPAVLPPAEPDAPGGEVAAAALTPVGVPAFREPPDVLAQLAFWEATLVRLRLDNHCKQHANSYRASAESRVDVYASDECTNTAPPPCPVKLTAAGVVAARVWGDLNYVAKSVVRKLADRDRGPRLDTGPEVPALAGAEPLPSFAGSTDDSHDHHNPPRRVFNDHVKGKQKRLVKADDLGLGLVDYAELYGAVVVPVEVWPTTDRVSAAIWSHAQHALTVLARDTVTCDGTCCGARGTCHCAPKLSLALGPGTGLIRTGGADFDLERPHGQKPDGGRAPWTVRPSSP